MTISKLTARQHHDIFLVTQIGEALGNVNLVKGLLDDSLKFWKIAVDSQSGEHLIENVVMNSKGKVQAIADYALQLTALFTESRYPTLALLTKRALILNVEHRKTVVNHLSSVRFPDNEDLFRAVVLDLLCFDPFVVDLAIPQHNVDFVDVVIKRSETLVKFILSSEGNYKSDDDWTPEHDDLADMIITKNLNTENREEWINASLEIIISGGTYIDLTDLLLKAATGISPTLYVGGTKEAVTEHVQEQ